MTSASPDKSNKNLTLRLPDEYHRQLLNQAEQQGLTLNAHLLNIVRRHLMGTGYYQNIIKSMSGRLFEIIVTDIPREQHPGRYFACSLDIIEAHPLYNKRRARYIFALATELTLRDDPYGAVRDLGIAMLNFYNRQALEIDQLAWQSESQPVPPPPAMEDNWRYIGTEVTRNFAEFLIALGRNHWKDPLLTLTGQSQDVRLDLWSDEDFDHSRRRPILVPKHADFERYAYDTAEDWIQRHGTEELTREHSDNDYEVLPRYVRKQIDCDQYYEIVLRCWRQLLKKKRLSK